MKAINRFSGKRILLGFLICLMMFVLSIFQIVNASFAQDDAYENGLDEEAAQATQENNFGKNLLSVTLKDTDLREVLNILAFKGGVNIVAGDDVDTKVNVQLKDVPWEQALDVILKTYNYTYKREGNLIRVMSLARAFEEEGKLPLETRIIPLNFANVSKLKDSLAKILSSRGTIEIDTRTNCLIITDVPETVQKVEIAAMELDTKTPQVLIEAMMVDVKITDNDEWGTIITRLTSLKSQNDSLSLSTDMAGSSVNNISFNALTDSFDIGGIIDAWVYQNKASILASPKVLTLDNQEAKIEIIEKIPYVETVDTGGGSTTNIKFEEAGVKLSVTPHITSGRYISMNVKPEQSFSTGSFGGRPVIDQRRAETNLLVRDGQTIVIGGLRQSNDTFTHEKVPFLGDIPFLGLFFKKKIKLKVETELVLFVTPHIVVQSMLSDREVELFEQLSKTKMIELDHKTEMQRLKKFTDSVKQRMKAKKIAEEEVLIRQYDVDQDPEIEELSRQVRRRRKARSSESELMQQESRTPSYAWQSEQEEEAQQEDALEVESRKFRESLKKMQSE